MKAVLKNMEAIFLAAVALTCVTTYASAEIPKVQARHAARVSVEAEKMAVVTVAAKRLSAAEKAKLN